MNSNNQINSRSLDSDLKPDKLISNNVGIVSDTNSYVDQTEKAKEENRQNGSVNNIYAFKSDIQDSSNNLSNGLIFNVNGTRDNQAPGFTAMRRLRGRVTRDSNDLENASSSGGDSDVTLDSYSESNSNDESLNFSSDEDDTGYQSTDEINNQFESSANDGLNTNEGTAVNSKNERADTNNNDSDSLNFSTSEEEDLSTEEENRSNSGKVSTGIISENQEVANDINLEKNRKPNEEKDTKKNDLNDFKPVEVATLNPSITKEDKSIQNHQPLVSRESFTNNNKDGKNEIQERNNELLTGKIVNEFELPSTNEMHILRRKDLHIKKNNEIKNQGQSHVGKTIANNTKKLCQQEPISTPHNILVQMDKEDAKNLNLHSSKSNTAEEKNSHKEKEKEKADNVDGLIDTVDKKSRQKSESEENFSFWKKKLDEESVMKRENKKDNSTTNVEKSLPSTSRTTRDFKISEMNHLKLSVKMPTGFLLNNDDDTAALNKKINRKESLSIDKNSATVGASHDGKGSRKRVSFSNLEENKVKPSRKSFTKKKSHFPSTHPFLGKLARISEGKYKGVTGRVIRVRSNGWWVLDSPELKNRKVQSGQCELIEKVPDEVLVDYYSKKEKKSNRPPILHKSKYVSESKQKHKEKNIRNKKRRRTIPISEVQSLANDRHTKILPGDDSSSVLLRRRRKFSHYNDDNSISSSSENTKDICTTSIHSQITRKKSKKDGEKILNHVPKKYIQNEVGDDKMIKTPKDMDPKPDFNINKISNNTNKDDRNLQNVSNSSTGISPSVTKQNIRTHAVETAREGTKPSNSSTLKNTAIHIHPVGSTRDGKRLLHESVNPPIIMDATNNFIPSALKHLPSDYRVDIFDRKTCKVLSGTNAVALKDLPKLLRLHAEYEPIIPPPKTSSTRKIEPIQRQGRTSANIRVSETVNRQARIISAKSIGKQVMIKNGQYRGSIGKISLTLSGGWVMVSGLNKLNLDTVFHSSQLEYLSSNELAKTLQGAQKNKKSLSIGKEKATDTLSMFKDVFDEYIRVPYRSLSLKIKGLEEDKDKIVKQMFLTVKSELQEQDAISKELGSSLNDSQCKSSLANKRREGSDAQHLREELTLIEKRMAAIKKELNEHIDIVKTAKGNTLREFEEIL